MCSNKISEKFSELWEMFNWRSNTAVCSRRQPQNDVSAWARRVRPKLMWKQRKNGHQVQSRGGVRNSRSLLRACLAWVSAARVPLLAMIMTPVIPWSGSCEGPASQLSAGVDFLQSGLHGAPDF